MNQGLLAALAMASAAPQSLAEKMLMPDPIDYDAIGRAMMTYDEAKLTKKREYWYTKGQKPDKREHIMNLLVCPPCADHKETRSRAHLGPFIDNGRGLIHENCPWQKGGVL